ncbi:MAG: toll/interleukin-1 receptor domain-containing protein, partial [Clostridia bacterium]|nr:toll/interleukin-1 receptor domain-containing protein [Clostridia bacterium]
MAQDFGFVAYDVDNCGDPFVFISYKSDDWERVAVYARYLHDHGVNVWYDNGLHAGSDWESYLMSVIEKPNCRAVLLFVSAAVAQSSVIPLETTHAREHKKPTVAVYLEGGLDLEVLLNKAIKVYVNQRQSVFAYNQSEKD